VVLPGTIGEAQASSHGSGGDLAGHVDGVVIDEAGSVRDVVVPLKPGAVLLVTYSGEQEYLSYRALWESSRSTEARVVRGRPSRSVWEPGQVVVTVTYPSPDGGSHKVERTVDLLVGKETEIDFGDE